MSIRILKPIKSQQSQDKQVIFIIPTYQVGRDVFFFQTGARH